MGKPEHSSNQPQEGTEGPADSDALSDLGIVPLFPLPNVVLFPRAVLPLHIFEERYKAMTRHALEGDRRVAMALLRPGWEKHYYERPAIEPVVCVGQILAHEELPNGTFNFLLQGVARARIVSEVGSECYRQARVRALDVPSIDEDALQTERLRLGEAFTQGPLGDTPAGAQFLKLMAGGLSTSDLVDLVAFNVIDDAGLKQSLLAETDVRVRIARTLGALGDAGPVVVSHSVRTFRHPGVN